MPTHIASWLQLLQGRIEVGGDLNLAQAVNSSLYCMNFQRIFYHNIENRYPL